ncbi:MAG: biotin synthase BioB [Deltaproteobacteria bacterium]|nr:MAG: biotin synthase BioB [Deltaproteobacteria bacterium]
MSLDRQAERIINGQPISFDDALDLARYAEPLALARAADRIRHHFHGNNFDLCSIINAKSGRCSEDCRFCAQSAHYHTVIKEYDIIDTDEALVQAKDNRLHGIGRFSLVTAGRSLSIQQLKGFGRIFDRVREEIGLYLCASMGMLTKEKAAMLAASGVRRYHCNLETAASYFSKVCTTHTWQDKVDTIKIARDAGMEICSGGIIGLGESMAQRLELAFELARLKVRSIPINILVPIANTPLAAQKILSLQEVMISIAMFRLINPKAVIRLAGGRNQFGSRQYSCFEAGANGAIVGNYLTTSGNDLAEDLRKIKAMGFVFNQPVLAGS